MIESTEQINSELRRCEGRMVRISTAHINDATAHALDRQLRLKKGVLWESISYVSWHEFGWVIYTGDLPDDAYAGEYPELRDLIEYIHRQGIEHLALDCDAAEIEGLPRWEW